MVFAGMVFYTTGQKFVVDLKDFDCINYSLQLTCKLYFSSGIFSFFFFFLPDFKEYVFQAATLTILNFYVDRKLLFFWVGPYDFTWDYFDNIFHHRPKLDNMCSISTMKQ